MDHYLFKNSDSKKLGRSHADLQLISQRLDDLNICQVMPKAEEQRKRIRLTLRKARAQMRYLKKLINDADEGSFYVAKKSKKEIQKEKDREFEIWD